jgi:hypothetical protein
MARRVFFSFDYDDVWRASTVRNAHVVDGRSRAGFHDFSLWEKVRRKGDAAIERMIDDALKGTSVTVVLIGARTARSRWVRYEIQESLARGNGILGVYIDGLADSQGHRDPRGSAPAKLLSAGAPCYGYDRRRFGDWVEKAALDAGHRELRKPSNRSWWSW